ncbi:MAG: discoidin domain-containing protein [Acidobacteriia bacterium]|nr:discoidin domain-containing protein [Terriglobia bacterium]
MSLRAAAAGAASYTGAVVFGAYDQRLSWKVVSSSSFQRSEGDPANVLDGAGETYWISRWRGSAAPPPHNIVLDFGETLNVASVLYTGRAGNPGGRVKDYEIYLSGDGKDWGDPVSKGTLSMEPLHQTIAFAHPVKGRYLKFAVLSEHTDGRMAAIAELDVGLAK